MVHEHTALQQGQTHSQAGQPREGQLDQGRGVCGRVREQVQGDHKGSLGIRGVEAHLLDVGIVRASHKMEKGRHSSDRRDSPIREVL